MYRIIDDLIPPSYQDQIEILFSDQRMNWNYRDQTSGVGDAVDRHNQLIKENAQFVHEIFSHDSGAQSSAFEQLKPVLFFVEDKMKCNIKGLSRIKANLLIKDTTSKGFYHPPHVDNANTKDCYILLYYINDSDGPTIIFDKDVTQGHTNLSELVRVEPKKGRGVLLKSSQFHASSNPVENDTRLVINYVFHSNNLDLTKTT